MQFDASIQFTYETETECKFIFLDILFHRRGYKIIN